MKTIITYACLGISLLLSTLSNAQLFTVKSGIGVMSYVGDLTTSTIPSVDYVQPSLSVELEKQIYPKLHASVRYLGGSINGRVNKPYVKWNFLTHIDNVNLNLKYTVIKSKLPYTINFNTVAGVGYVFFNPGKYTANGFTSFNDAGVIELSNQNPTKAMEFSFGYEAFMDVSKKIRIGVIGIYHNTLTDYLDGISLKANPLTNDAYFDFQGTIGYRFGNSSVVKRRQHQRNTPAFFR